MWAKYSDCSHRPGYPLTRSVMNRVSIFIAGNGSLAPSFVSIFASLDYYSDCCLWNILWANVECTHSTGHQLMIRFGVFLARVEDPGLVHLNSGTSTPRRPLLDQRRGRSKRLVEVRVTWGTLRAHNLVVPIRWTPRLAIPCAHCSHSDFLESLCSSNWGWSGLVTHFLPG